MASIGTPQERIATTLGIGITSLRKHYRKLLDSAEIKANVMVADSLFAMAVGRPAEHDTLGQKVRAEQTRNVAAAIF